MLTWGCFLLKSCLSFNFVVIDWVGGLDTKMFGSRLWCTLSICHNWEPNIHLLVRSKLTQSISILSYYYFYVEVRWSSGKHVGLPIWRSVVQAWSLRQGSLLLWNQVARDMKNNFTVIFIWYKLVPRALSMVKFVRGGGGWGEFTGVSSRNLLLFLGWGRVLGPPPSLMWMHWQ